jgi:hypothetical protein
MTRRCRREKRARGRSRCAELLAASSVQRSMHTEAKLGGSCLMFRVDQGEADVGTCHHTVEILKNNILFKKFIMRYRGYSVN